LPVSNGRNLGAAISDEGTFMLLFAGLAEAEVLQNGESRLYYTMRPVDLPGERPPVTPVVEEPTPSVLSEDADSLSGAQEQPAVAPTVDLATLEGETAVRTQFGPIDTTSSTGRILAGALPAGLIVLLGMALGFYALRKRDS
jgi:hypothetical protein